MIHQLDDDYDKTSSIKSCLGESLRRLQQNLKQIRRTEARDQDQFQSWLKRWSACSDQIAGRLEMIDSQLEQLPHRSPPAPHFTVVANSTRP